jgi:hypothetical protein
MEIHEPFSDLEKQISDMLDQLNKQEPLSTAACKQVVAGLEKIKEYQINPSPKSKKEKMPTMDVKIDDLIRGFHETADDSKQQLQSILALISEGRVPDAPAMSQINATVDKLREQYTDVCQAAAHSIPAEEMPQEGSPADAYVEAVKNSKFLEYRNQLDEMHKTLEKFVSVQSLAEMYATALAPYQKEAQELMQSINALSPVQKEDVAAFEEKTAGPAAFLKALACSDYDTDEGWELLDAVPAYYSRKVYTGLSRNQYFLPKSTKAIPAPKDPAPVAVPVANAVETEEAIKTAASDMSTPEAVAEAAAPKTEVISPEKDADDSEAERWHKLGIDDPQTYLYLVSDASLNVELNPKAEMVFSAKKFESEITRRGDFSDNAYTLVTAWKMDYVDSEMLLKMSGGAGNYMSACESLFNLGYLQKYEVKGYPCFYALTDRGSKIFTTQKSAQLLKMKKAQGKQAEKIEDAASSALARVLLVHAFKLGVQIGGTEFSVNERVATDAFYLHIRYSENDIGCSFAGIIGKTIESFESVRKDLFWDDSPEAFEDDVAFIVLGMNKEHAHRMAEFFDKNIHDIMSGTMLCYYDYETKICYRYADDTVVDLSELAPKDPEVPEGASAKTNTAEDDSVVQTEEMLISEEGPLSETFSAPEEVPVQETTAEKPVAEELPEETPAISEKSAPGTETQTVVPSAAVEKVKNDPQRDEHMNVLKEMLEKEQFYCATAYLRALAAKFSLYKPAYDQLAYAVNDPANSCSYNSDKIYSVYFNESSSPNEHFAVAAACRNVFYDHRGYDYTLPSLHTALEGNIVLDSTPALKNVLYQLKEFKSVHHHGVDYFADYRQTAQRELESRLKSLQQEATSYYSNYILGNVKETATMRRFIEAKKIAFRADGFLGESLKIIVDGDNDPVLNSFITEGLKECYIREGDTVCRENIDAAKVDAQIDDFWEEAERYVEQKKKTAGLVSSLRTNLTKQILKVVDVLAEYADLTNGFVGKESDEASIDYQRARSGLLKGMQAALQECAEDPDRAGSAVLKMTLTELISRLDGSYVSRNNRYFYQDFLRGDLVMLDGDTWLPVLNRIPYVENFSIIERIAAHSRLTLPSYEEKLKAILDGEDDYGSGSLIMDILSRTGAVLETVQDNFQKGLSCAANDVVLKKKAFVEELELAQSYGQIREDSRKEAYIKVVSDWYDRALADQNYGFFRKILDAIMEQIRSDARSISIELTKNMDAYLAENSDWESSEEIRNAVERFKARIKVQNYAAAEDQLNRLKSNDLSASIELPHTDHLQQFITEYQMHSSRTSNAGMPLQSMLNQYRHVRNKEARGAARLVDNWPRNGGSVNEESARNLLEALGFNVASVEQQNNAAEKNTFTVRLKSPVNGRKSNYTHPIYIFGSEAETAGFRVVYLFGRFGANDLMERIERIGNARNTLLLVDCALTMADRRLLARLTKKMGSGKTFAVVDRIVISYLANHYSETSINRTLMAVIMPYASNQPYISDSTNVMPPELFMGRRFELEKIESSSGANIVYGGRQLGKSALLRMARKDINYDENGNRAVLVDIKGLNYQEVAQKVSETLCDEDILSEKDVTDDWNKLSRSIRNRLRDEKDYIPYLLLMMDEADVFIESCEAVNYSPFDALKDIQSIGTGRFKFVVAGLRNVVRFKQNVALGNNSVLTHLSSLTVTPFKAAEARELLETPLWYLGFRFASDSATETLISTIFGTTNYFPGLIQLYCSKLIEALQHDYADYEESETPPYIISENHVKKTLSDETLLQQIREKFIITLKVDQDDYYYLIALLGAYHYHFSEESSMFSAKDIQSHAREYGIKKLSNLSEESIHALMEEMRELNVLQSVTASNYRFARYNFCQMMGSEEEVCDKIEEESQHE